MDKANPMFSVIATEFHEGWKALAAQRQDRAHGEQLPAALTRYRDTEGHC